MEKIKKNLGFGFMRLPMQGEEVDLAQTQQMVDAFLAAGFNYFDTAHGYLDGRSETALKACLTSRYPREDYVLTNKLTANFFKTEADIRPFFESQLAACGVDDFDFYLMHAQSMKILSISRLAAPMKRRLRSRPRARCAMSASRSTTARRCSTAS